VYLIIHSVGRVRGVGWQELVNDYVSRIRHYVRCDLVEHRDDKELGQKWPRGDVIVALEVDGNRFSSVEFSRVLERWGSQGKGQVCMVIGGAEGIPEECSKRATHQLSLSTMTLPHRLAKVVLLEQLYRALTILKREPYAREL
jgi:23S rRNA (pseudouridine1915-N3)-methyltransferase